MKMTFAAYALSEIAGNASGNWSSSSSWMEPAVAPMFMSDEDEMDEEEYDDEEDEEFDEDE
ncbi:MAG: hypothetical protein ACK5PZ_08780, partial [Pirellula sp.]